MNRWNYKTRCQSHHEVNERKIAQEKIMREEREKRINEEHERRKKQLGMFNLVH